MENETKEAPKKEQGIIGYVELADSVVKIKPMDNHFIHYTFEDPKNWETLKAIANIIYEYYIEKVPNTAVELIKGEVEVKTEYSQFQEKNIKQNKEKDKEPKTTNLPRRRDIRSSSTKKIDCIEFQIRTKGLKEPIEDRSVIYVGLSMLRTADNKPVQELWLLAGDLSNKDVLQGKACANYKVEVIDEKSAELHPTQPKVGLMYVNLDMLSKEQLKAGELAKVLLGTIETKDIKHKEVRKVAEALEKSFEMFKADKEVKKVVTVLAEARQEAREEVLAEARQEAREEARQEGIQLGEMNKTIDIIQSMISMNFSTKDIMAVAKVDEKTIDILRSKMGEEEQT